MKLLWINSYDNKVVEVSDRYGSWLIKTNPDKWRKLEEEPISKASQRRSEKLKNDIVIGEVIKAKE